MADIQNYLFIDGNYLRKACEKLIDEYFGVRPDLDFATIKGSVSASKAFYYDAIDEGKADAPERRATLDKIGQIDGFHVVEGTVSGGKTNRRQKRVDVALTVDMLTHAFYKNMWHATLITGDQDFRPLVDALIRLGTHLHIYYERTSSSNALYDGADIAVEITLPVLWNWSTAAFKRSHPIPSVSSLQLYPSDGPPGRWALVRTGQWARGEVRHHEVTPGDHHIFQAYCGPEGWVSLTSLDAAELERYFAFVYSPINWTP